MKKISLILIAQLALSFLYAQLPTGDYFKFEFTSSCLLNTSSSGVQGFNTSVTAASISPINDRFTSPNDAADVNSPLVTTSIGSTNVINSTACFWFRQAPTTSSQRMFQIYGTDGAGYRIQLSGSGIAYNTRVINAASYPASYHHNNVYQSINLDDNVWHHIAVRTTFTGTQTVTFDIFIDNVLQPNFTSSNNTTPGLITNFLTNATMYVSPLSDYTGDIDDIYFYKRALTNAEISDVYNHSINSWLGTTSNDWNTSSNWSNNSIPTIAENAIIPDVSTSGGINPVITPASTIFNVSVKPNAGVTIMNGVTLNGSFKNLGNVTFKNNAFLDDFTNGNAIYIGDAVFERTVTNGVLNDQRFIASPVSTPNVSEIGDDLVGPWGTGLVGADGLAVTVDNCSTPTLTPTSNYGNLFEFNEALISSCPLDGWVVRSTGALENARGYSAYLPNASTFDFVGIPNTGAQTIATTNSSSGVVGGEGWNLLGNPYPSPLSRDAVILAGATDVQYFVTSGVYQGTYTAYGIGSNIAIGQGFQAHVNTSGNINFDNSMRNTGASTWYQNDNWFEYKLEVSVFGTNYADKTTLFYNNDATNNYEPMFDVRKRKSNAGHPSLSTFGANKDLTLNGMSVNDLGQTVPMNLDAGSNGTFVLSFEGEETFPANTTIYVKDLLENIIHNIADGDYSFSANTTDNESRFELIFVPAVQFTTTKMDCFGNSGSISLSSTIGIQNRTYQIYKNGGFVSTDDLIDLNEHLQEGVYELVVTDEYNGTQNYSFAIEAADRIEAAFDISKMEVGVGETFTLENLTANAQNFSWQIENSLIENIENLTYSFENEGVYDVLLAVDNEECSDELIKQVSVVNKTLAIRDNSFEDLSIYPNPTNGIVYINTAEVLSSISLLDITGKTIKVFGADSNQLDISEITLGIYFIEIANAKNKSVIKIIKK